MCLLIAADGAEKRGGAPVLGVASLALEDHSSGNTHADIKILKLNKSALTEVHLEVRGHLWRA